MKRLYALGLAGAVALVAGCDRSSDRTEVNESESHARTTEASELAPTSRDDANTRIYSGTAPRQPDNTGLNARDRGDATLTPENQGNSEADIELLQRVRRAVNDSDQLSTMAKNVKIITHNGMVTIRGPVNSEAEKQSINALVQQLGVTTVDNQLEVKTETK